MFLKINYATFNENTTYPVFWEPRIINADMIGLIRKSNLLDGGSQIIFINDDWTTLHVKESLDYLATFLQAREP